MLQKSRAPGLLGDTADRDYSRKLSLFNRFAEPELRRAIGELALQPGMRVVDAGCGSGEAMEWLSDAVGQTGIVVGMDLASGHARAARRLNPANSLVVQGDLRRPPLIEAGFDLVWCVNTINHVADPLATVKRLTALLRSGGRIVLGQSALLPEMFFSWDARLERLTNEAVRLFYRERYGLEERDLTAVRALVGLLRNAELSEVTAKTQVIERLFPLATPTKDYLLEAVFRDTWGERLKPYLAAEDHAELSRLCDPQASEFALDRTDFHFLQTLTVTIGALRDG